MTPALLEKLLAARHAGQPMALATLIPAGSQALIDGATAEGELALAPDDLAQIRAAIAEDKSRTIETSLGPVFVEIWNPPLRLVVVGAVHIAQALAPMAARPRARPVPTGYRRATMAVAAG